MNSESMDASIEYAGENRADESAVEAPNLMGLMEDAFLANQTLHFALKEAGVSRSERRRAMRFVTRNLGMGGR